MRLFYINAFVTPVFTVAFRPESRSHSYSYAPSIHDEIRRVKTGFGFNIYDETPSKRYGDDNNAIPGIQIVYLTLFQSFQSFQLPRLSRLVSTSGQTSGRTTFAT